MSEFLTSMFQNRVDSSHPGIAYVGRVKRDELGHVHFRLPGVQIHARLECTAIAMEMAPYSGYFMVELDDIAPYKVESPRCEKIVEIASGLPAGEHKLTITYCNEGEMAPPVFYGFVLNDGGKILDTPELPQRKIEFIGDSITCGYGNEDHSDMKSYPYRNVNNAYYSYAQQVARGLNAQCVQVARSGICLNYDRYTPGVGVFHDMVTCYPYTLFSPEQDSEKWDCGQYVPDVVCINLGTNDCDQPEFDKDVFARRIIEFVNRLRAQYAHAIVVLLLGPMLHGEKLSVVKYSLDKAQAVLNSDGDGLIYRFDFTPDDGSMDYGTALHPTAKRHAAMASELIPFLKDIMSW